MIADDSECADVTASNSELIILFFSYSYNINDFPHYRGLNATHLTQGEWNNKYNTVGLN
jgi:hypothetical protein